MEFIIELDLTQMRADGETEETAVVYEVMRYLTSKNLTDNNWMQFLEDVLYEVAFDTRTPP